MKAGLFCIALLRDPPHITVGVSPAQTGCWDRELETFLVSFFPPLTLLAPGNLHAVRTFSVLSTTAGLSFYGMFGSAQPL